MRHSQECTADSGAIHEFLGTQELLEGDPNEAVAELKKALAFSANYDPRISAWEPPINGSADSRRRPPNIKAAIDLGERDAETYIDLGVTLFNRGQAEASKAQYIQALAIDPNSVPANYNLAWPVGNQRFRRGRHLRGAGPPIGSELGKRSRLRRDGSGGRRTLDEAIRHLQRAVELEPNDQAARQELAQMLSQKPNAFQTSPPR